MPVKDGSFSWAGDTSKTEDKEKIVLDHIQNEGLKQCSLIKFLTALTFLDGADFLNILLELNADLTDNTAVLLAHLSSQERAFGGHALAWGWDRVSRRQLGAYKWTKKKEALDFRYSIITYI